MTRSAFKNKGIRDKIPRDPRKLLKWDTERKAELIGENLAVTHKLPSDNSMRCLLENLPQTGASIQYLVMHAL